MSILPIDLQVTFTKANEYEENIAKQQNIIQTGQSNIVEKAHQQSIEINNKVNNLEEYSEEFTKINTEKEHNKNKGRNKFDNKRQNHSNNEKNSTTEETNKKSGLKENGVGNFIDIIE